MGFGGGGPAGPTGPAGADGAPGATGATGPAGSANITGTSGKLVKFTGTDTGGDAILSDDGSVCTVTRSALGAASADGLILDNATNTGTTEQRAPRFRHRGYGRKTGTPAAQVQCAFTIDTTFPDGASNPDVNVVFGYDRGGSAGTFFECRTNVPSIGGAGIYINNTIMLGANSSGVRAFVAGTPGFAFTGNGGAELKTGTTNDYTALRNSRTDTGNPCVSWADGETRGAAKVVHAFGDGTSFTQRSAVYGDGLYDGPRWRMVAKTTTYTAALFDYVVCDSSGGAFTVTLPTAVGNTGKAIRVRNKTSTNNVTIATTSSQTVTGTTTLSSGQGAEYVSDGAGWIVL